MRPNISQETMRGVLKASLKFDLDYSQRIAKEINAMVGQSAMESAEDQLGLEMIIDWIADLFARRLLVNNTSVPIFQASDMEDLFRAIVSYKEKVQGKKIEGEELEFFVAYMKEVAGTFLSAIVQNNGGDFYNSSWRWAEAVLKVAKLRGQDPLYTVTTQEGMDAITRELFTMDEYIAMRRKALANLVDENLFKTAVIENAMKVYAATFPEEDLAELRTELERELVPMIADRVKAGKQVIDRVIGSDIVRIYD